MYGQNLKTFGYSADTMAAINIWKRRRRQVQKYQGLEVRKTSARGTTMLHIKIKLPLVGRKKQSNKGVFTFSKFSHVPSLLLERLAGCLAQGCFSMYCPPLPKSFHKLVLIWGTWDLCLLKLINVFSSHKHCKYSSIINSIDRIWKTMP